MLAKTLGAVVTPPSVDSATVWGKDLRSGLRACSKPTLAARSLLTCRSMFPMQTPPLRLSSKQTKLRPVR